MTRAERLRQATDTLAQALAGIMAALEENEGAQGDVGALPHADATVAELAARFHRSPSTIRGWLEAGRFPGAYKLNGRDWRVPPDALAAFLAAQRTRPTPEQNVTVAAEPAPSHDLGAWRRVPRRRA